MLINERRQRIESGFKNADDMDRKLGEIDELRKGEVIKGEKRPFILIRRTSLVRQIRLPFKRRPKLSRKQ